jgi:membrane-associated phospholipid phosphatase
MWRLSKSVLKSAKTAIVEDPGVRKLVARYPRFFGFMKRRVTADEKFGLGLTFGLAVTGLLAYIFFGVAQDLIGHNPLIQSDLRVVHIIQIFRTPGLNRFMLFMTDIGDWQMVAAGLVAIGALFVLQRRIHSLYILAFSVAGGEALVWTLKHLFSRQRPPLVDALTTESGYSFPSGHGFVAFSFYGLAAYFIWRSLRSRWLKAASIVGGLAVVLTIGISRIYLGVHWASDVLASWALGAAWLAALITSLEIRERFNHHPDHGIPMIGKKAFVATAICLATAWCAVAAYFYVTHPLEPVVTALAETRIELSNPDASSLFANLPRTSESLTGSPMEPIGIILIGTRDEVLQAFSKAGWVQTDPITPQTLDKLLADTIDGKPYSAAPGVPSLWNTMPNELSFAQPTQQNTIGQRHHFHLWEAPVAVNGEQVWFGTAHFDKSIWLKYGFLPIHSIDPAVDTERDKVLNDLTAAGSVENFRELQIVSRTLGTNAAGDQFFTDGMAYEIFLK